MDIQPVQENFIQPSTTAKKPVKFGLSIAVIVICLVATAVAVYWILTEPVTKNNILIFIDKNSNLVKYMNWILLKDDLDISNRYWNMNYYKIFKEIKSPFGESVAVLFGLDYDKTKECCMEPFGLFVVSGGKVNEKYVILKGALEHLSIQNVEWQDENKLKYDIWTSDEGGNEYQTNYLFLDDNSTVSWQNYRNEEFGFEFKYPRDWGNATITKYAFSKDDVAGNPEYESINTDKVAENTAILRFDGKFCSDKTDCWIFFSIQEYSTVKPFRLNCYEGYCGAINILEEKEKIEKNSNISFGGFKGELIDGLFKPSSSFTRVYTIVNEKYEFTFSASYDNLGFKFDTTKHINLDEIADSSFEAPNQDNFKLFLTNLSNVVSTFKFIK